VLNLGVFVRDLEHGSQTCKRAVHRGSAEALLNSLLSKLVRTFGCDLYEGRAQARTVPGGIQLHKNRSRLSWANTIGIEWLYQGSCTDREAHLHESVLKRSPRV
jgi:hypothetical protein